MEECKRTDICRNIMSRMFIGLQRESEEKIVKSTSGPLEGIESYLYIRKGSCGNECDEKVTEDFLESHGISTRQAWEAAGRNVSEEAVVLPFDEVVPEADLMFGVKNGRAFVVTNQLRWKGASAILNTESLHNVAHRTKIYDWFALPSSIHEWILIPCEDGIEKENLDRIVSEINRICVDQEDQLSDRAYVLEIA